MATRVPARLTASAGRRFGVTVGAAFLVLMVVMVWRERLIPAWILGALGTLLLLAGLVIPTRLGPVERAWMGMAHAISRVTTPVLMAVIYYAVLTPTGVLRRLLGGSPLVHTETSQGFWKARSTRVSPSKSMERQF